MLTQAAIAKGGFLDFLLFESILERLRKLGCFPRMSVLSRQDRFLLFTHALPASGGSLSSTDADEDTQPAQTSSQTRAEAKTVNILVVEDEGIVALHIKRTLMRLGHNVLATVDTGKDAIFIALEEQPDLILMDVRLKGEMDGIEAAHAIRQRRAVPIIYLTGQLDESTVKRAQSTKPVGYLAKPFIVSDLSALIQKVFDQKGAKTAL